MEEFLKKNKFRIIVALIAVLFLAYIINGIKEHSTIPDHIHSIDDKAPEDRTDEDNITILRRSIQNEPGNIDVMIQLSDLYIKTNDTKSAEKTLREILEIDPSNKEAGERLKKLE